MDPQRAIEKPPEETSLLVVDDNYALLEVLREHLVEWGYEPTTTTNGSEAQRLIESNRYHVVLADLRMSPVSGWEVIRRAKERNGTEVIVMTGYADLESSLEALHQRVFDFLPKPLDFDRLERAIRNAAQQSVLARENKRLLEELSTKAQQLEKEVAEARTELEERTIRDELTHLYNQGFFVSQLEREVNRSHRYHHRVALGFLDLDRFRTLNDRQGHSKGDVVLERFAALMETGVRGTDSVCRYAGEEFAIIFPETSKHQAEIILNRIGECLKEARIPVDEARILTFSAGLAGCPEDADTASDLVRMAEGALQKAKQTGRDCLVLA